MVAISITEGCDIVLLSREEEYSPIRCPAHPQPEEWDEYDS